MCLGNRHESESLQRRISEDNRPIRGKWETFYIRFETRFKFDKFEIKNENQIVTPLINPSEIIQALLVLK